MLQEVYQAEQQSAKGAGISKQSVTPLKFSKLTSFVRGNHVRHDDDGKREA